MDADFAQIELSILAGLIVYAMAHQAWLWWAVRRFEALDSPRLQFWTIGWGGATLAFLGGRFAQRTAILESIAIAGVRVQYLAAVAMALLSVGLAHATRRQPRSLRVRVALGVAASVFVPFVWWTDLVVTPRTSLRIDLLGNRYWSPQAGPGAFVVAGFFIVCAFVSWRAARAVAESERSVRRAVYVIVPFALVCGLNDVLLSAGLVSSLQVFHYACVVIALAITYVHVRLYTDVYGALTRVVQERTSLVEVQQHALEETLMVAERARRSAEALIEGSPDAIVVVREGRVVFANRASATMFGRELAGDLVGGEALDLVDERDREHVRSVLESASGALEQARFIGKAGHRLGELRALRADFDDRPSTVLLVRDVTEQRAMQNRLALADRLVSVGTLAAGVAHEINNPLTYVIASLDSALGQLRDGDPPSPAREELEQDIRRARVGSQRIADVVGGIKTLSRVDEEEVGAADVRAIVESAVEMTQNEIRHRATLVRDFADVPPVRANPSRLRQVFLNLLVNAAQAIAPGAAASNEIRIRIRSDGPRIAIEVSDTGPGMTPDVAARVFDPFFTTKKIGEGTGLGLAICHGIVTAMGGSIELRTGPSEGTTFIVRLDATDEPVVNVPTPAVSRAEPPAAIAARILVVDDQPDVGRAVKRMLRAHDVTVCDSGSDALERLRVEEFDLVICDVMMPEVAGPDFFERCRAMRPDRSRRIVFMTGGVFSESIREFIASVPNPTLEKPFDPATLHETIDARLRELRDR